MMAELLTAAQMRAIEAAAIGGGAVTGLELMERAGRSVVEAAFAEWPELAQTPRRAVVLCGPGNNGGDGFVVARLLKDWGWSVAVFLSGDPARLPPDARVNHERWRGMGEVAPLSLETLSVGPQPDMCIDALFGTGLSRPVASEIVAAVGAFAQAFLGGAKVVAVDICSGLCADSGRVLGGDGPSLPAALRPDLTVSFHRAKCGHYLAEGPAFSGRLRVADIGLGAPGGGDAAVRLAEAPAAPLAKTGGHKYAHGHALILAGGPGRGGAARLAARAALRIGAGLVTLGCPPAALTENAARLDAIMLREVGDDEALDDLMRDRRINALGLGPGLGLDGRAESLVAAALRWHLPDGLPLIDATEAQVERWMRRHGHRCACVLDADALTILARRPELFAALHPGCVLTPHGGEFARLFPDLAERLAAPATEGPAYSKVDATREAARRAGCVVLYKGPDTVIADPESRCTISSAHYDRAVPWLATAGSGDVLAGFIAGLLARGLAPMAAAETAAWLHVECALEFGPGLIAEDLPERLPAVLRRIGR